MYEDYLENFVFKTAKFIAMKLFGRIRRPRKEQSNEENEQKDENNGESSSTSDNKQDSSEKPKENKNDLNNEKALVKSDSQNNLEDIEDEDEKSSKEIEKMLEEVMAKQREEKLKNEKNQGFSRVEYDMLTEGLDEINFHLPLFFMLIVITILGLPSVVTWAKNYHFTRILSPDPMRMSATIVLTCLGFIWQFNTPRDV